MCPHEFSLPLVEIGTLPCKICQFKIENLLPHKKFCYQQIISKKAAKNAKFSTRGCFSNEFPLFWTKKISSKFSMKKRKLRVCLTNSSKINTTQRFSSTSLLFSNKINIIFLRVLGGLFRVNVAFRQSSLFDSEKLVPLKSLKSMH